MRTRPTPAEAATLARTTFSDVASPLPRRIERVRASIASPLIQPSQMAGGATGFAHLTPRWIAQAPNAAFVARLEP